MGRLGISIVTVLALFVTPAVADILTVCSRPDLTPLSATQMAPLAKLSQAFADARLGSATGAASQVALARDDKGFDVVLNWHGEGEQSLRASGADIFDMALGDNLIHLMIAGGAGGLEHFLFSLDDDGAGELLWSRASDDADAHTSRSVCTSPR
ncbi:MAG TPA: hypothetical protein VK479_16340 [Micropepsaceae bacterium]|nr:hypothetical protein [Micropepsaceae bacterium]